MLMKRSRWVSMLLGLAIVGGTVGVTLGAQTNTSPNAYLLICGTVEHTGWPSAEALSELGLKASEKGMWSMEDDLGKVSISGDLREKEGSAVVLYVPRNGGAVAGGLLQALAAKARVSGSLIPDQVEFVFDEETIDVRNEVQLRIRRNVSVALPDGSWESSASFYRWKRARP